MKFGPVPVSDAEGAILAHSMRAGDKRLKKGRILASDDLAALMSAGIEMVTVALPEAGDMLEDEAAHRVARALVLNGEGQGLWVSAPFTGRANLYAERAGVLTIDTDIVRELNDLHEAVTFATLMDHARVTARQMVGTVKVIPYGAPSHAVEAAEQMLRGREALQVHGVRRRAARLILTRTPGMKDGIVNKGAAAVRARLVSLGVDLVGEDVIAHETGALAKALTASKGEAQDMTLILTGSATSDRGDVGPAALQVAGGVLTRFGMPVDPGNLLFLGELDQQPVIGLPGCARSPKLNGADWVIERLACGLDVSSDDIAAMGVGGLLKEIPSRPAPRGGGADAPRRPVVAAVMLAAGGSTRMRGRDKLLEEIDGLPLISRVAEALKTSAVDQTFCVTRAGDDPRWSALAGAQVTRVENPRASEGMATSIAAGIAALGPEVDAALIVLADMPDVGAEDFDRLLAGFDPGEDRAIIRAVSPEGRPGHPVLFGRRFFEALQGLEGDSGAKAVVAEHPEFVADVTLTGVRAVTDLDTPEDWAAWRAERKAAPEVVK
ncbi:MAG: molybdopterin-binding/glycosyltransferase family 2 protein [Pseudomonadota bacterium]